MFGWGAPERAQRGSDIQMHGVNSDKVLRAQSVQDACHERFHKLLPSPGLIHPEQTQKIYDGRGDVKRTVLRIIYTVQLYVAVSSS